MFKSIESLGMEKTNTALELEVRVLNINKGRNETISKKCQILSQYSAFIAKVREFQKENSSLQEAIKKAVVYCREHDILKELLERNASEAPGKRARTGEGVIGGNMAWCRPRKIPIKKKAKRPQ